MLFFLYIFKRLLFPINRICRVKVLPWEQFLHDWYRPNFFFFVPKSAKWSKILLKSLIKPSWFYSDVKAWLFSCLLSQNWKYATMCAVAVGASLFFFFDVTLYTMVVSQLETTFPISVFLGISNHFRPNSLSPLFLNKYWSILIWN